MTREAETEKAVSQKTKKKKKNKDEGDRYEQLKKVAELHKVGILTVAEFAYEKQKILRGD